MRGIFKKDVFGHILLLKRFLLLTIGTLSFPRFNWINRTEIQGTENLTGLPGKNVLFVSNHQTYFIDVLALYHVFGSIKWKFRNKISNPLYLLNPKINLFFVAARETMRSGIIPRILAYTGAIPIKRTWREAGREIKREVDLKDFYNIGEALKEGWVITFPQGTTTPFAPGRTGTAHIIKEFRPIVIPVVIDGFNTAFDKTGLKLIRKGTTLRIKFKEPMNLNYEEKTEIILEKVMQAIEQSPQFQEKN
jgi:1-acyl-sn-glycerol-3-phosphate acyltransferase